MDPERRLRYYLSRAEDALDAATTTLQGMSGITPEWAEEFHQDLAVLRSKLDTLRVLMNGR
jgi:hypothetical protein